MFAMASRTIASNINQITASGQSIILSQHRNLFPYLRIAFNRVDADRLAEVGPDRLCAEWLLKNGGAGVTFYNENKAITDYNVLPPDGGHGPKIHTFDGTGSSIMAIGFDHFEKCKGIQKVILHQCTHMENEALQKLVFLKDSLVDLQVTQCYNVEDSGLLSLKHLDRLQLLTIYGFRYVKDFDGVVNELKKSLPKCQIQTEPSNQ